MKPKVLVKLIKVIVGVITVCFAISLCVPQIAAALPPAKEIGSRMAIICALDHPDDPTEAEWCCTELGSICTTNCGIYGDLYNECLRQCEEAEKECKDTVNPSATYMPPQFYTNWPDYVLR